MIDHLRDDLRRRGLIDERNRLTPAGNAYCDAVIAQLKRKTSKARGKQ